MSITHVLKVESTSQPNEVLNLLLTSNIGLHPGQYDQMKTPGNGLYGRVFDIDAEGQNYLLNAFEVRANLRISFDEDFDGDRNDALEALSKAITLLLKKERGDAMFFWVIDTPILKRTNDTIQVTNEPEFDWLRNALDKAGLKYELKSVDQISNIQQA